MRRQNRYTLNYVARKVNGQSNKKVVLIGGSFDIIHVGHVRVLERAKKFGDILVVALNSDAHIKIYKPALRPIIPEKLRAEVVNSIKPVDYTFITDNTNEGLYDPNIYNTLRPDILI